MAMIESRSNQRTWKQNKDIKRAAKRDREYFAPKPRPGGAGSASQPRSRPAGGRSDRGGRGRQERGRGGGSGSRGSGFSRKKLSPEQLMKITRCGICKQKGHWHRECPEKDNPKYANQRKGMSAYMFDGVVSGSGDWVVTPELLDQWKELGQAMQDAGVYL
eukprot:8340172-Pyramimonas_sp.AAC.1